MDPHSVLYQLLNKALPQNFPLAASTQKIISPLSPNQPMPKHYANVNQAFEGQISPVERQWMAMVRASDPDAGAGDYELDQAYQKQGQPKAEFASPQVLGAATQQAASLPTNEEDFLNNTVFPITDGAKIPRSIAAGMFGAEGRLTSPYAQRNNYYNISAFDSNPDAANRYDTPQAGVQAFARFITGQANNYASPDTQKKFQQAGAVSYNPDAMMKAIQNAGYAGDPSTWAGRSNSGFRSYADFVKNTPEWQKYR